MNRSLYLVMIIILLMLPACAYADNMLLEYKDVQFFILHETQSKPVVSLEISGLAFHSSLAVEKVEAKAENKSLIILVYLTPARRGLTGNFTYNFDVPESVDFVTFGPNNHLIWKRGSGPVK